MYLYCGRGRPRRLLAGPAGPLRAGWRSSSEQTATKFAQRMADRLPALAAEEVGAPARFQGEGFVERERRRALEAAARAERARDDGASPDEGVVVEL